MQRWRGCLSIIGYFAELQERQAMTRASEPEVVSERSEGEGAEFHLGELGPLPEAHGQLRLLGPLPYLEFLSLQRRAAVVITDSGGIQEETTFLGVPCLTVRDNTERPITVT